jgi:hypothetical protein
VPIKERTIRRNIFISGFKLAENKRSEEQALKWFDDTYNDGSIMIPSQPVEDKTEKACKTCIHFLEGDPAICTYNCNQEFSAWREQSQPVSNKRAEGKDAIDTWLGIIKYQIDTLGNGYADIAVFEQDRELFESILLQYRSQPSNTKEVIDLRSFLQHYEIWKAVNGLDRSLRTHEDIIEQYLEIKEGK